MKLANQTVMNRTGVCGNYGQNGRKRHLINPFEIVANYLRTRLSREKNSLII